MQAEKVLVTGGGGFLGQKIVEMLLAENYQVRVLGRNHYPLLESWGVELFQGDISNYETVLKASKDTKAIFNCAAKAGIWGTEESYFKTNVVGPANVIRAAKQWGIKKIIHTSSPSVVHNGKNLKGINENYPYGEHKNYPDHYPRTKTIAEKMILSSNNNELFTTALRPHLIWGPNDPHLLPRILEKADKNRLYRIKGGPYLVDTTYIDNAAWAHILAFKALKENSPVNGQAYFISQGEPLDLNFILNSLLLVCKRPSKQKFINLKLAKSMAFVAETLWRYLPLKGEPPLTRFMVSEMSTDHWFDLKKAEKDLAYKPLISFQEGLEKLKASFLN